MRHPVRAALALPFGLFVFASCSSDGPTVPPVPVEVETEALAEAIEGEAYSATLEAAGGSGGFVWAVASGSLPAGLTLASSGTVMGTPTTPGTASFVVRATDSAGDTASARLSIEVVAALTVHLVPLPKAVVGEAYARQLVVVGGRQPYVWSRAGGSAGAWLTVSPSGELRGTPDVAGSFTVTVAVTDGSGQESTRELALVVVAPVSVTTTTVPEATQGRAYGVQLEAAGGDGSYIWSLDGGALPEGLALSGGGAITGTPDDAGTFTFAVRVADGLGLTATRSFTLEVEPAPTILTTLLAPGTPGVSYSASLEATGGTGTYLWSLVGGSLPAGLELSAAGVVSGTPSTTGTASFTVRVTDAGGKTDDQELSITVVGELGTLESGVAVTGLAGEAGSDRYFVIDVPAGTTRLKVSIAGGSGDADLYLRSGALPLDFTYDCRPLRKGNDEICEISNPAAGGWYVRVRGFEAYAGVGLVATIEN